jgi:hypothetical protein
VNDKNVETFHRLSHDPQIGHQVLVLNQRNYQFHPQSLVIGEMKKLLLHLTEVKKSSVWVAASHSPIDVVILKILSIAQRSVEKITC